MPPQEKEERQKKTVELYNRMATDPIQRQLFSSELCKGLGSLLMLPTPILEQIINAEEADLKRILKQAENKSLPAFFGLLANYGAKDCRLKMAMLKAFYEVRPQIITLMRQFGAEKLDQIPD